MTGSFLISQTTNGKVGNEKNWHKSCDWSPALFSLSKKAQERFLTLMSKLRPQFIFDLSVERNLITLSNWTKGQLWMRLDSTSSEAAPASKKPHECWPIRWQKFQCKPNFFRLQIEPLRIQQLAFDRVNLTCFLKQKSKKVHKNAVKHNKSWRSLAKDGWYSFWRKQKSFLFTVSLSFVFYLKEETFLHWCEDYL